MWKQLPEPARDLVPSPLSLIAACVDTTVVGTLMAMSGDSTRSRQKRLGFLHYVLGYGEENPAEVAVARLKPCLRACGNFYVAAARSFRKPTWRSYGP